METILYVANLAPQTMGEDLRMLFSRTGQVVAVDVVKDKATGKSKGFAFVTMASGSDAGKAISEYNGYTLDNRRIKVNLAQPRQTKLDRPAHSHPKPFKEYKSYNESIRKNSRPNSWD